MTTVLSVTEPRPPKRTYRLLGRRIAELRRAAGLSQRALAEHVHVSQAYPASWETGRARPDAAVLMRVADVLSARYDELAELAGYLPRGAGDVTLTVEQQKATALRRIAAWPVEAIEALERMARIAFSVPAPPPGDASPPSAGPADRRSGGGTGDQGR